MVTPPTLPRPSLMKLPRMRGLVPPAARPQAMRAAKGIQAATVGCGLRARVGSTCGLPGVGWLQFIPQSRGGGEAPPYLVRLWGDRTRAGGHRQGGVVARAFRGRAAKRH